MKNKFEQKLSEINSGQFKIDTDLIKEALEIASKNYEEEKPKRWKPEKGDRYWVSSPVWSEGYNNYSWRDDDLDESLYEQGLIYDNFAEAAKEAFKQQRINIAIQKMKDIAGGFKPDWENVEQAKWAIWCNHKYCEFHIEETFRCQASTLPHFPTEELAQKAIDEIEDLKLVFGVE